MNPAHTARLSLGKMAATFIFMLSTGRKVEKAGGNFHAWAAHMVGLNMSLPGRPGRLHQCLSRACPALTIKQRELGWRQSGVLGLGLLLGRHPPSPSRKHLSCHPLCTLSLALRLPHSALEAIFIRIEPVAQGKQIDCMA